MAQDPETEPHIAARLHAELAQYEHAKLRAIEVTGKNGGSINVSVTHEKERLADRIAGIASRIGAGGNTQ